MKPEQWQRVNEPYYAALERDAGARAAYLTEACTVNGALDEELRHEVESLLASNDQRVLFSLRLRSMW